MKKTALLAAAAALISASPAAADAGYLGLTYGSGEIDTGASADTDVWTGDGAWGFSGAGWGAQVDGALGNVEADGGSEGDYISLGGHLWWSGDSFRLGGVLKTSQIDLASGTEVDDIIYGVEGSWAFTPNVEFASSYTVGNSDVSGAGDRDTWNWDAGLTFFPAPNFSIGGFAGVGNFDGPTDVDTSSFGLNGEWQPWSTPVSFTLGWNNIDIDDANLSSDVVTIGARWNFGRGTLQDRHAATPFNTSTGYVDRLFGFW